MIIEVTVVPSSGKQECRLDKNGTVKWYLKSAPEKGKANIELCTLIARALRLRSHDVAIVSGITSRRKRVAIATPLTYAQVLAHFGVEHQIAIV